MVPDTKGDDGLDGGGGGCLCELPGEIVIAAKDHNGADGHGDDQADDLVPGAGGDEHGDGEEGAADEEGAHIAGEDGAVVGISEVVDSDDDREGEEQRDQGDGGGGEEFSDDGGPCGNGEAAEKFDGAVALLIGPEFHADGRGEEHVEPRVPEEERILEGGITQAHEVAEGEGEAEREDEEDDDDRVGGGLGEVGCEFSLEDGEGVHGGKWLVISDQWEDWASVWDTVVSVVVTWRKRSVRDPLPERAMSSAGVPSATILP